MVRIGLKIKANLTNVNKFYPQTPEQFNWAVKVKCTGCGEDNPNWHLVCQEDEVELVGAKANFLYKCKCCSRENYFAIIPPAQLNIKSRGQQKKVVDSVYTEEDDDKFKLVIGFDCRGLEMTDYEPRDGWVVESGPKVFEDVDLSSKEWVDYNDIDNVPVEINNFTHEFENLK